MATEKTIALCNIPELTNTYNHVINFKSLNNQINYFTSKRVSTTSGKISIDNQREVLFVNKTLYELKNVNYLYLIDDYNKYNFYFIINKSYKTSTTSMLEIECDVFQTYMFNYEILDSFVDRCHVDRWKKNGYPVSKQFIDEGLEYGEYIIQETDKLYPLKPCYIITSTNPLGTLGTDYPDIDEDEKEQTTPGIGINPENPDVEWPEPEEPEAPRPEEPQPGENDGNTMPSGITGFPNDISGLIKSPYSISYSSTENYAFISQILPTTSGEIIASENTILETWTEHLKVAKEYHGGMLISSKYDTDVYNPHLYNTLGDNATSTRTKFKVVEIGTGKPSRLYKSGVSTRNENVISNLIEYGNYIIFQYTILTTTNYFIVGFLDVLPTLNVNDEVEGVVKLGKVGDISTLYNSGDLSNPYYGCYIKTTDITKRYNYIDKNLQGKMTFGKNSGPSDIDLSEYTKTTCPDIGEYIIPIKNGAVVRRDTNLSFLKDLSSVSSNIIAPVDCKVLFSGIVDYRMRGPKIYPMMEKFSSPYYITTNYMVLELNSSTRIIIDNFHIPTVSTGDIVKQGQSIAKNYANNMVRSGYGGTSYKGITMALLKLNGNIWESKDIIPEYPTTSWNNTTPQWSPVPSNFLKLENEKLLEYYREEVMEDKETISQLKIIEELKKERSIE